MGKLLVVIATSTVLVALMGLSAAYEEITASGGTSAIYSDVWKNGAVYNAKTEGTGYGMNYMWVKMKDYEALNYGHGSGSLDSDVALLAYERSNNSHPVAEDWNDKDTQLISLKEDVNQVYSPMSMAVGTGYYAANPVNWNSLLKEKTSLKMRASYMSMIHEIEYAHAIDKDLEIYAFTCYNHTYDPITWDGGQDWMKINENVTQGKIHVGYLAAESDVLVPKAPSGFMVWKNRDRSVEIDEDYWGTYHLERFMGGSSSPTIIIEVYDDWLPCCYGGYSTMPTYYRKDPGGYGSDVMGLFDCTCWKQPGECATTAVQY
jgi:hypothetical protein